MKYLFVDFDGVLHGDNTLNEGYFTNSELFCNRLAPYRDDFKIVISSSWRETYEFEILVEAFTPALQDLVIGHTPILDIGMNNGGRYQEIIEYCEDNHIKSHQWIAIDDMDRLFPKDCPNLVLTNYKTGITDRELDIVEKFITSQDLVLNRKNKP